MYMECLGAYHYKIMSKTKNLLKELEKLNFKHKYLKQYKDKKYRQNKSKLENLIIL